MCAQHSPLPTLGHDHARCSLRSGRSNSRRASPFFQQAASFLGQGATGAIVVIEADVDGHHFRVKRIADTDDSKVFEVQLT